jgi:hypothetical protein
MTPELFCAGGRFDGLVIFMLWIEKKTCETFRGRVSSLSRNSGHDLWFCLKKILKTTSGILRVADVPHIGVW